MNTRRYNPPLSRQETINDRPMLSPGFKVEIDVTPKDGVVSISTSYGTYAYTEVTDTPPAMSERVVSPAMYYHNSGVELTFTGTVSSEGMLYDVTEWHWDFGDGVFDTGDTVTHTYKVANIETICHLKAINENGEIARSSMNLMLRPGEEEWMIIS